MAATQMEIDSQEQEAATLTEETKEGQKRVPPGVTGASPDKKKPKTDPNTKHIDITKVPGMEKRNIVDFGGTGECGWLALAGAVAMLNGKSVQQILNQGLTNWVVLCMLKSLTR